jgi:hypothetical protein
MHVRSKHEKQVDHEVASHDAATDPTKIELGLHVWYEVSETHHTVKCQQHNDLVEVLHSLSKGLIEWFWVSQNIELHDKACAHSKNLHNESFLADDYNCE